MSYNPHRVKWIGRDGVKGRWCHAPGCYTFAPNVKTQLAHADGRDIAGEVSE